MYWCRATNNEQRVTSRVKLFNFNSIIESLPIADPLKEEEEDSVYLQKESSTFRSQPF